GAHAILAATSKTVLSGVKKWGLAPAMHRWRVAMARNAVIGVARISPLASRLSLGACPHFFTTCEGILNDFCLSAPPGRTGPGGCSGIAAPDHAAKAETSPLPGRALLVGAAAGDAAKAPASAPPAPGPAH